MATIVPPPPITGPLQGVADIDVAPGFCSVETWGWSDLYGVWESVTSLSGPWDQWPRGYYVLAHPEGSDQLNPWYGTTVVRVVARQQPDGSPANYSLKDADQNAQQSNECPVGFSLDNNNDTALFPPGTWCEALPVFQIPTCPDGTVWDPATETCKAIVIPPPIFFPPQPPPPSSQPETGTPDTQGDEITYELCLQMKANADAIIFAINQLQ